MALYRRNYVEEKEKKKKKDVVASIVASIFSEMQKCKTCIMKNF